MRTLETACLIFAFLSLACAPPAPASLRPSQHPGAEPRATTPRRIVAASSGEVTILPGTGVPGNAEFHLLVSSGLTVLDQRGIRQPYLAARVPAVENGLWTVFPDGRMETTWSIRPGARWHDGTPVTADDLLLTAAVGQDRDLPMFSHVAYRSIDGIEARDGTTVLVRWNRPYIDADALFTDEVNFLLPAHLLGRPLSEDKAAFTQLPYWTQEYAGTGPYRLSGWIPGSHLTLLAFDQYVLGRPKIDEIELRFVPDSTTLIASILGGAVDLTLGRSLSIEQAVQVRDQWRGGEARIEFGADNYWLVLFPQFIEPTPAMIADVRFRRALMHAIDRQEMADTLNAGLVPVAHSYLSPNQPEYRDIEARIPRYDYDPRRATQMIEALGYTRTADGSLRDPANQKLEVEIRNIGLEISRKSMFAVADYWQRVGIGVATVVIPQQRVSDYEYRATFSGFQLFNQAADVRGLPNLHSSRTRLPENSYLTQGSGNHSRYMNPEFDALLEKFSATIPRAERILVLGEISYHIADRLNLMGLFYNGGPEIVSSRITGVTQMRASGSNICWNAHEWTVRG